MGLQLLVQFAASHWTNLQRRGQKVQEVQLLELLFLSEDDEGWKWKARVCEIHTRRELQLAISTVTKWPNTTLFNTRALIIIIIIIIIIMIQAVDPGSCFY